MMYSNIGLTCRETLPLISIFLADGTGLRTVRVFVDIRILDEAGIRDFLDKGRGFSACRLEFKPLGLKK